jgi:hypothetical protein
MLPKKPIEALTVCDIALQELSGGGYRLLMSFAEVVIHHHLVPGIQQSIYGGCADVAGPTRDDDSHPASPLPVAVTKK